MTRYQYAVMDGRALIDIESATMLSICDSLDEAISDAALTGGDDSVIVRYEVVGQQLLNPEIVK